MSCQLLAEIAGVHVETVREWFAKAQGFNGKIPQIGRFALGSPSKSGVCVFFSSRIIPLGSAMTSTSPKTTLQMGAHNGCLVIGDAGNPLSAESIPVSLRCMAPLRVTIPLLV